MAGVIFLFFSILVGMWVFARIMYPSRGRLPLPNQDAPANDHVIGSVKPAEPAQTNQSLNTTMSAPDSTSAAGEVLICAFCAKPLSKKEAITQAGASFCSAEHLIEHQKIS